MSLLPCVVFLSLFPSLALAAEKNLAPHVHGEGKLSFVFDLTKNEAEITFHFPAIQVLGFEHKPKTVTEKKLHQDTHAMLKDPKSIFSLITASSARADCVFGPSKLKVPYLDDHTHGHSHEGHDHADYELSYSMKCKNLKAVEGLQVSAFKTLKGLNKLNVEGLVDEKAFSQQMSSAKTELLLK